MLLWTLGCICLFHLVFFFFPLEMYPAVKLLDYMAVLYLRTGTSLFPVASVPIYIPTNSVLEFHFLYICSNICFFLDFFTIAILTSVRLYLMVVLICISVLMISNLSIFSCACWPSVCLLWKRPICVFCPFLDQVVLLVLILSCISCLYFGYVHLCSGFSCVLPFAALWTVAAKLLCPWDSPGKNTGVSCHAFLQRSSQHKDWTHVSCVSCIADWFFTAEPLGKPYILHIKTLSDLSFENISLSCSFILLTV